MRGIIQLYAKLADRAARVFLAENLGRRITGIAFYGLFFFFTALFSVAILSQAWRALALDSYKPSVPSELYDRKGRLITTFFQDQRILAPEKDIPTHLKQAFIAMEDNHFYEHAGISPQGIFRAFLINLQAGQVKQGGSTITQQLAKVVLTDQKRTFTRKIKEAALALIIDAGYSKDKILHLYCNQIYFGHGNYGVEAASQFYFDSSVKNITVAQAAILATLPSSPNRYSPIRNPHLSRARLQHALMKMVDLGFIDIQAAQKAEAEATHYYGTLNIAPTETAFGRRVDNAPYFSETVRPILEKEFGKHALYNEGLKIHTGLDLDHQKAAQDALWRGVRAQNSISRNYFFSKQLELSHEYSALLTLAQMSLNLPELNPQKRFDQYELHMNFFEEYLDPLELVNLGFGGDERMDSVLTHLRADNPFANRYLAVQGALAEIDNMTGEVTAVVGGLPFSTQNQINRAIQMERQPGSSFKPLLYAAAIETKKVTAATQFPDSPIVSIDERGDLWMPENYSSGFRGFITLRDALRFSVNTVSITVAREVGLSNVLPTIAKELYVKPQQIPYNLSIALGTHEVSPLGMARGFSHFARGGESIEPVMLKKVFDRNNKQIKDFTPVQKKEQIISAGTATIVRSLLETAVQHGTGSSVRKTGYGGYAAGKTGTTNGFRDAWFVGFNKRYTAAVWVGYDRPSLSLGPGQAGAGVAAPIWANYQSRIAAKIADEEPYLKEAELTEITFCRSNGLPATASCGEPYKELFLDDTGPETGNKIDLGENTAIDNELTISVPAPIEKKPVVKTKDFFEGDDE
ncbi:MAG: PBP1A family penicillin-binding protein [Spirochaetes bacterium]|nr:PBP1A family penicillin-binding protein [Spirochaetota bacterium]MBX3721449.1 PBP1A family penicillin-binding protein [Turneriella sp.]